MLERYCKFRSDLVVGRAQGHGFGRSRRRAQARALPPPAPSNKMHRRSFLATLGSLTAVGAVAACAHRAKPAAETRPVPRIGPVGLQLYTVRSLMEKDVPG